MPSSPPSYEDLMDSKKMSPKKETDPSIARYPTSTPLLL